MRTAVIPLFAVIGSASVVAVAHSADDPVTKLRACSQMDEAQRRECLDKLSREMAPPRAPAADNWLISETTSPVDYKPVVVATTHARSGSGVLQFSIHCRGGRIELAVAGPALARGSDHVVTYRINAGPPVQVAAGTPLPGTGVVLKGDGAHLLRTLPEDGEIAIQVSMRDGATAVGAFSLQGMAMVRNKVAAACR